MDPLIELSTLKDHSTRRRSHSLTDIITGPAKAFISNSLTRSLTKRKKSYSLNQSIQIESIKEVQEEKNSPYDDFSFSHNVWFYGYIDITNFTTEMQNVDCSTLGQFVVRIDENGEVVASIMYKVDNELHTASLPKRDDYYCLNFSNPYEPKFRSIKQLVAYLIRMNYLEQVSFSWLLENSFL